MVKETNKEKGFAQQPFDSEGKHYETGDVVEVEKSKIDELTDKSVGLVGKEKPKGETKEAKGGEVKG